MTEATDFAYAGARMQARYGVRPGAAGWNHLARISDFAHLLQAVRGTAMAPWVAELTANTGAHQIERALRGRFREEVDEVARWLPRSWRRAAAWLRWLPDLPTLAHVRHQRRAWPWLEDDAVRRALVGDHGSESGRRVGLERIGVGSDDGQTVIAGWLEAWRACRPGDDGRRLAGLGETDALVRSLIDRQTPWEERRVEVEPRLRRLFRRHVREPAGAFAYLALVYIQFTRLRGLLLQLRLFQATAGAG